jgi:hypothetical protein
MVIPPLWTPIFLGGMTIPNGKIDINELDHGTMAPSHTSPFGPKGLLGGCRPWCCSLVCPRWTSKLSPEGQL